MHKVVPCNRPLATNFGIGEALCVFDPASKTRNAEWREKPKTVGNKTMAETQGLNELLSSEVLSEETFSELQQTHYLNDSDSLKLISSMKQKRCLWSQEKATKKGEASSSGET